MSPAVTDAVLDNAPVHKQLPAVELSHNDQCVYDSVLGTFVHERVAEVAFDPEDAALHEAA